MVEHRALNAKVEGSIPSPRTINSLKIKCLVKLLEMCKDKDNWLLHIVCKDGEIVVQQNISSPVA